MGLAPGNYQPADLLYYDAGNEPSHFKCFGALITADNHDDQVTLWTTLQTKIAALVLGAKAKAVYAEETTFGWSQPTNGAAREVKLLVQSKDSLTGQRGFSNTLPTLNPAIPVYVLNINARDVIRVDTPSAITDFITAFNAFAINPNTGNPLTVIGLKVVGRNN
jgi:hypothetical protein